MEARNDEIFLYLHQEFTRKETGRAIILGLVSSNLIKTKLKIKIIIYCRLNNLLKILKKMTNHNETMGEIVHAAVDDLRARWAWRMHRSHNAEDVCRQSIGGRPQAEIIHGGRLGGCFRWQMRSCVMP